MHPRRFKKKKKVVLKDYSRIREKLSTDCPERDSWAVKVTAGYFCPSVPEWPWPDTNSVSLPFQTKQRQCDLSGAS